MAELGKIDRLLVKVVDENGNLLLWDWKKLNKERNDLNDSHNLGQPELNHL